MDFTSTRRIRQKDVDLLEDIINVDIPYITRQCGILKEETKNDTSSNNIQIEVSQFLSDFESLVPSNGKLSGNQVKAHFQKSGLPSSTLFKIWNLADIDNDGELDLYEFSLAKKLISLAVSGQELPKFLPLHIKSKQ